MHSMILVHVVAGSLGLIAGYLALWSAKGRGLHRRSGTLFVSTMTAMALSGAAIAAVRGVEISVIAGLTTAYLTISALTTVCPDTAARRRVDRATRLVALAVGAASVVLAIATWTSPIGRRDGYPAILFLLLGSPSLLGGLADLKASRAGVAPGAPRLKRHLWRMCTALLIAALSFFLGQADEIPQALRLPALLALPPLAVLATMLHWLWRLRRSRHPPSADPSDPTTLTSSSNLTDDLIVVERRTG